MELILGNNTEFGDAIPRGQERDVNRLPVGREVTLTRLWKREWKNVLIRVRALAKSGVMLNTHTLVNAYAWSNVLEPVVAGRSTNGELHNALVGRSKNNVIRCHNARIILTTWILKDARGVRKTSMNE